MPDRQTETSTCPVCGHAAAKAFARRGFDVHACPACTFMFVWPPLTHEQLTAFYDAAASGMPIGYYGKEASKLRRSLRRARALMRRLAPPPGVRPRFLDVGSNVGYMVEAARRVGFEAHGVEPEPACVAAAREHYPGGAFHQGFLEDLPPGEPFDAVYCSEVIEHAADPDRFMAHLARVVRPGGVLYLTTPDFGHWSRPRDLSTWHLISPPGHCLYFTRKALKLLLARHGFRIETRRVAFKPGIKYIVRKV